MERPYAVKLMAIARMETKEPQYYIAGHEIRLPFVPVPGMFLTIRRDDSEEKAIFPFSNVSYDFDGEHFNVTGFFDSPEQVKALVDHSSFGPGSAVTGKSEILRTFDLRAVVVRK